MVSLEATGFGSENQRVLNSRPQPEIGPPWTSPQTRIRAAILGGGFAGEIAPIAHGSYCIAPAGIYVF